MRRPLVIVALLYVGGVLLADTLPFQLPFLLPCSLLLAFAALGWNRARPHLLAPVIVLAGTANLTLHTAIISPHDLRTLAGDRPRLVTVRGTLSETPNNRVYERDETETWRTLARLEVTSIRRGREDWQPALGRVAVSTPGVLPTNYFAGVEVEITGVLRQPKPAAFEGAFDYRTYLKRQGIYHQLRAASANDWQIISSLSAPPLADRFRAWTRKVLALGLPAEDESLRLEWALTLGWRTALTDDVSEPFVRAATYHIFAVDGLRMAIIFGILFALFRALRLPRAVSGLLLVPAIWFYAALTGWPASAIRATVMLTIVIVGWALKRPSDLINSLFTAAFLILVWQPQQLFQAGFQLSFFVVLCIILVMPTLNEFGHRLLRPDPLLPEELRPRWQKVLLVPTRFLLDFFLVSLAAWLGSIPLVAYYFHILTPVSAPANLVAVPLCALVLTSNMMSLLLAGWFSGGAEIFNHAGWFLMECIRVTSHWFANWPGAYFYVATPTWFTTGLYYLILLTVLTGWIFKTKLRVWKIAGLAVLTVLWCLQWQRARGETRLTIIPLNGGSAIYFDAPGNKDDLLIDCGNTNSVEFTMKLFLRARGVNHLPCLVLTHGDVRCIGGVEPLCGLMPVEQIATSSARFRSPTYRRIAEALQKTPRRWRVLNRGDQLGGWTVLHPNPDDHFPQADDNALVLLGGFHGTRVLLLSDLGRPGQNALLERAPDLRADIVVAGLPTEGEPLSDALLEAIKPRLIVIADAEFPATRRASPQLRQRLAQRGVKVIYTREAGSVSLLLGKGGCELRTMAEPQPTPAVNELPRPDAS